MARYQSGAIVLHTTDLNSGSAINIGGITSMDVSTGTETMPDESGSIYDEIRSIASQIPVLSWSTKSLSTWLNFIGLAGYCISSDGTHPGLRLYGNVLGDCKDPPLSTDNAQYTVGTGLIILGQITATRGQDAILSMMCHPLTDGTNAPLAGVYSSITLPTPLLQQQYCLGTCKVGTVVLSDLESVTMNFGVQISDKTPQTGSIWPDSVAVRKIQPSVVFSGFDPTILDDTKIPLLGKQAAHANTLIQFKKRQNYSTFVADATEEHIAMTMNGIAHVPTAFSGSGNAEATGVMQVDGIHDGTNVPILIDVTSVYDPTP